jgi:DNA oxidative demethylase
MTFPTFRTTGTRFLAISLSLLVATPSIPTAINKHSPEGGSASPFVRQAVNAPLFSVRQMEASRFYSTVVKLFRSISSARTFKPWAVGSALASVGVGAATLYGSFVRGGHRFGFDHGLQSADLYLFAQTLFAGGFLLATRLTMKRPPSGFVYHPHVLTADQEDALLAELEAIETTEVKIMNRVALRRVAQFGFNYRYGAGGVRKGAPIPEFLQILLEDIAPLAGKCADDFDQVLINRYPTRARIDWHTDDRHFGPTILVVSLGAEATLQLKQKTATGYRYYSQTLGPRSTYVLSGAARATWEHRILPVKDLRYSITFRSVKKKTDAPPPGDVPPGQPTLPFDAETKPSRKAPRASLAST